MIRHMVGDAYDYHILTRRQVQRERGEIRKIVDGLEPNKCGYKNLCSVA
jgi:hypothetical protein